MNPRKYSIHEAIHLLNKARYTKQFAWRERETVENLVKIEYCYTINRGIISGPDDLADIFDCAGAEGTNAQFCIYHQAGRQIDVTN
jgi:hypothetical protein